MNTRASIRKRNSLIEDNASAAPSSRSKYEDQVFIKLGAPAGKTGPKSKPDPSLQTSSEATSTTSKANESSSRSSSAINKAEVTKNKESYAVATASVQADELSIFVEIVGDRFEFLRKLLQGKVEFPDGIDKIMCDKRSAQEVEALYNVHKSKESKENVSSTTSRTSTNSSGSSKNSHRKRKHSKSFAIVSPSKVSDGSKATDSQRGRSASESVPDPNKCNVVVPFDGVPARYGYGCTEPYLESFTASVGGKGDQDSEAYKEVLEASHENFGQGAILIKTFQPATLPVNPHLRKVKVEGDYVPPRKVKLEK